MSLWTAMFIMLRMLRPALINIGLQWVLGTKEVIREDDGGGRTSKETGFSCSGSCSGND